MKFGYVLPHYPLELIWENAVSAENNGFDSLWMLDHTISIGIKKWQALETWSILSGLSQKTQRVTLGACVSDAHRRHPAVLAQTVATLDIMSGGRAIVGMGAGEAMNLNPYGINWSKPVSKMHEAITVMKKLWTEESVNYKGKFFQLNEAFLSPKPAQKPHPPVWVAGNSPRTMRIAAELGDGWIPTSVLMPPEIYRQNLNAIEKWSRDIGREPSQIEHAVFIFTAADPDYETAKKYVEFPAKMLLCLTPKLLENHGVTIPDDLHLSRFVINKSTIQKLLDAIREVPFEPIEEIFVFGTPDDCIDKLERYVTAGASHFVLNFFVPPEQSKSMIEFYAKNVMSHFRNQ